MLLGFEVIWRPSFASRLSISIPDTSLVLQSARALGPVYWSWKVEGRQCLMALRTYDGSGPAFPIVLKVYG
jgi:hypothetical protein